MSGGGEEYPGFKQVTDGLSAFNVMWFIASQVMAGMATAQLFQVQTVTPGAGLLPGSVSGQIMVNQVGGTGIAVPHGPIYNVPFFRLQGGKNAFIIDPVKGDIGIAIFASRDISSVKANKAVSNPGSSRQYDYADALYLGGFLNGTPTQYVRFVNDANGNPTGIDIVDVNGNSIMMSAAGIAITDCNGNSLLMKASASELTLNSHTLTQHTHTQGDDSHGDTEVPTNKPTG